MLLVVTGNMNKIKVQIQIFYYRSVPQLNHPKAQYYFLAESYKNKWSWFCI